MRRVATVLAVAGILSGFATPAFAQDPPPGTFCRLYWEDQYIFANGPLKDVAVPRPYWVC